ncbi:MULTISPECIES: DUF986 family protein [Glaesserella]|uniref:UPF0266 membrane protein C5N92_05750 n=1 Tax=Glaesserella australis TaxID=2094024 RepID=A0A328BXS7_9PAST|nr:MULTISPECIES: DUF986 family protein [Glaesserella]AUI67038.1 hypothetical protein CJD39_10900 [Glaesserella sp. 15-184]RAL18869.1 hypothetical protein C5N92_05750 [Glaesserella australis]
MTNILLVLIICFSLLYVIYDQLIMDKLKGKTILTIRLARQAGIDSGILIFLIVVTLFQGLQNGIASSTVFLLFGCIVLAVYSAFIRYPRLLLKEQGFFFGNIYFLYSNIAQINLSEQRVLVIDLKNNKRLYVRIQKENDIEKVVAFFGGYKE